MTSAETENHFNTKLYESKHSIEKDLQCRGCMPGFQGRRGGEEIVK